jgi:flavin reductase (DIM6/NTAB) family NADH-FMN oxidoreductase RutF
MLTLKTSDLNPLQLQNYLQYAIAPRPICFATTIDKEGQVNLSPFSFFNMFSTNPPMCIFSPARRVRDNTTKHTLDNVLEIKECVINIVNYSMVQQMSHAKGVNEFDKSGFTMLPSQMVKPPRVAEAPVQFECVVTEVISLGNNPGAGNLVLAEIKLIHIDENILDQDGKIDQEKIDLVARLGEDWYCRVTKDNLFKVPKPLSNLGIGVDALPKAVRNSLVLTGNDLGMLGNVAALPSDEDIDDVIKLAEVKDVLDATIGDPINRTRELHELAKELLKEGKVDVALKVVLL